MRAAPTKKTFSSLKCLSLNKYSYMVREGLSFKKGRANKGYLTGWKYKGTALLNITQHKRYTEMWC